MTVGVGARFAPAQSIYLVLLVVRHACGGPTFMQRSRGARRRRRLSHLEVCKEASDETQVTYVVLLRPRG
jgi:hypothetical protein